MKATFKIGQVNFEVEALSTADLIAQVADIAANAPGVFQSVNDVNQANMAVSVAVAHQSQQTPPVPVQAAAAPPTQAPQTVTYTQPAPVPQQQYVPPQQAVTYAQAAPQQVQYAPTPGGVPVCPHGPLKDLLGRTGANGAPYKFRFYCAAQSNDPTKCNPAGRNA